MYAKDSPESQNQKEQTAFHTPVEKPDQDPNKQGQTDSDRADRLASDSENYLKAQKPPVETDDKEEVPASANEAEDLQSESSKTEVNQTSSLNADISLEPADDSKTVHKGSADYTPDGVPTEAKKVEDGNYAWVEEGQGETYSEEIDEPDVANLKPVTLTEDLKDPDGKVIRRRITDRYTFSDGSVYTDVRNEYFCFDENGNRIEDAVVDDEQASISPVTKVTNTDTAIQHTVTPGHIEVQMDTDAKELDENGNPSEPPHPLPSVTGAVVTVTRNNADDPYSANITLKLAGLAQADGVKVIVTAPDGSQQTAELKEIKADDQTVYTLSGIRVGNLAGSEDETVRITLTGKQVYELTKNTPHPGTGQNGDVLPGQSWEARFRSSDGLSGLGDAGNFSAFSKTFRWNCHANGSVAIGEMDTSTPYIGIGSDMSPAGTDELDYSNKDLCYIGSFKGNGSFAMNNTNSYLILGDQDLEILQNPDPGQRDLYTVAKKDTDGNIIQTVQKMQGNIKGVQIAQNPIDSEYALDRLADYADHLQSHTQPDRAESEEEKKDRQQVLDQIAKAAVQDTQGSKDIRIDCSRLPVSEDGTYLANIRIEDLQALNHDQFIHLDHMDGKKGLVNVIGPIQMSRTTILKPISGLTELHRHSIRRMPMCSSTSAHMRENSILRVPGMDLYLLQKQPSRFITASSTERSSPVRSLAETTSSMTTVKTGIRTALSDQKAIQRKKPVS